MTYLGLDLIFYSRELSQRKTIAYVRVSSHDQKDNLERQK